MPAQGSKKLEVGAGAPTIKQAPVKPVPSPISNFDTGMVKREEIRRRLREKERVLSQMITTRETSSFNDEDSTIAEDSQFDTGPNVTTHGKEEADRREAIRVLSQVALTMKSRLKKQQVEATSLQRELKTLGTSLKDREEQKSLLEVELRRVRDENKLNQQQLSIMKRAGEQKALLLKEFQTQDVVQKEQELQNKLTAAHQEVVWTQKDSMSKTEQIEYFEYQLLARNQEIDDMKQELNAKLRQIVELEIDLEIHDDRFHSALDDYSKGEGTIPSTAGDNTSLPKELIFDNPPPWQDEKPMRGFRRMLSWKKNKGRTSQSSASRAAVDTTSHSMVDRLDSDMRNLEGRYKQEKFQSRVEIAQLKEENNEYLIKVLSLEKSLQNIEVSEDSAGALRTDLEHAPAEWQEAASQQATVTLDQETQLEKLPCKTHFLEEKLETLENVRDLQTITIDSLRDQVARMEYERKKQALRDDQISEQLLLESDTKELKIAALERELHDMAQKGGNRILSGLHVNAAAGLEAKLLENHSEVVRLRKEQEIKDQKIEKLRDDIIELRLARMQHEKAGAGTVALLPIQESTSSMRASVDSDDGLASKVTPRR